MCRGKVQTPTAESVCRTPSELRGALSHLRVLCKALDRSMLSR